ASGQISATRIIAATTQNMGLWISNFRWSICGSKVTDTASTAAPATETVVMYIHGGGAERGTTAGGASGVFIGSLRGPGGSTGLGGAGLVELVRQRSCQLNLTKPYAYYLLQAGLS